MNIRIQIIIGIAVILALCVIINKIRNKKLELAVFPGILLLIDDHICFDCCGFKSIY